MAKKPTYEELEQEIRELTQVYHGRRQKQEKTANFESCSPVTC